MKFMTSYTIIYQVVFSHSSHCNWLHFAPKVNVLLLRQIIIVVHYVLNNTFSGIVCVFAPHWE